VAGMWREELAGALCWRVRVRGKEERHAEYRIHLYYAPSWSGASVRGGHVFEASTTKARALLRIEMVDVRWTLATTSPYGRIKNTSLTIRRGV